MAAGTQKGPRLTVEYPDVEAFLHDFHENISRGGTFVSSSRKWVVGDRIQLTLTFPGLLEPIKIPGNVSWARIGKEPGIGVEFVFEEQPELLDSLSKVVTSIERSDPSVMSRIVRVLIAEDNALIFEMIHNGLNRMAQRKSPVPAVFSCQQAVDGAVAIGVIENVPIDMMIVDVNLPVLDGDTLIYHCRELIGPGFPIIAVSGGGEESSERARKAGADIFLAKPLRLVQVYDSVVELLGLSDPR